MDQAFKELLNKSTQALKDLQVDFEKHTKELSEDTFELWQDIKTNFSGVEEKLKNAADNLEQKTDEANLKAHLGAMEAQDKIDGIKDAVQEFTDKVAAKTQTELDTAALRAHLAQMEARDFWQTKGKQIAQDFSESSDKVKNLGLEAASEVKDYFEKLGKIISRM